MRNRLDDRESARGLRRRDALGVLGGAGLTGVLAGCGGGVTTTAAETASSCILSPEVTEGPFWIVETLTRRDIREGKPGLPLEIVFLVEDARTCRPIEGADVEIWHCDAVGRYSGFDAGGIGGGVQERTSDTRYLRGHQRSGERGRARFLTVFPGWYPGRTPHIHLKVHVGGDVVHTGQVFFSERIQRAVYRRAPYPSHGQPDTSHAEDSIYAQAGRSKAVLRLKRRGGGRRGYRGTISLGVST